MQRATHSPTEKSTFSYRRGRRILSLMATSALVMAGLQSVHADEWTGAVDNDWFNNDNWSFLIAPTSSSPRIVTIDGSANPARIGGVGIENAEATTIAIGVNAIGALEIEDGGRKLLSGDATLGRFWGSQGVVSVNGADAEWGILGNLIIGNEGSGQVSIENGAALGVSGNVSLARLRNAAFGLVSEGALTINGGSLVQDPDTGTFEIGISGDAALAINNGGRLVSGYTSLGVNADGTADASIFSNDAANPSYWQANNLRVGVAGQASLAIGQGAVVDVTGDAVIGDVSGSTGAVLVFREASSALDAGAWNIGGALAVGEGGNASLLIGNGGTVDVAGLVVVADNAGSTGNLVVGSAGTLSTHHDGVFVGALGEGVLTLREGGSALLNGGALTLGFFAGSSGTLNIGAPLGSDALAPGILGASTIRFRDGAGSLVFNHTSDNYVFSSDISGNGLIQHRSGDTTLTGDGSAFTGGVFLEGGRLSVNGVLGGLVDVAGGKLAGTGQVGDVVLRSGSTIAPGNSIGAMNVAGNIAFAPGSIYEVEVNAAGASDLIHATGTATINGGTVEILPLPGYAVGTTYTILTADGGVAGGGFDGVNWSTSPLFITPLLSGDANNVYLTLSQTSDFADVALTPNQAAAASGIQSVGGGALFGAIAMLGDAAEARRAFDAISGEIHASSKTALIEDSRFVRTAALSRMAVAGNGDGLWAQGFGSWGHWNSNGNAARQEQSTGALFLGGDGLVTENIRLGLMGGYGHSTLNIDARASSSIVDSYTLGTYAGGQWDAFSLKGGLAHSWHSLDTSRLVSFSGFSDDLTASYKARTLQAYGEAAYRFDIEGARVEPFANLAHIHLNTDGYSETGGAAALTADGQSTGVTFSTLGLHGRTQADLGGAMASLNGSTGWRHAFGDTPTATHHFARGDNFTVAGVPVVKDALVLDLGVSVNLTENTTLGVSYNGQFGAGFTDQGLRASLNAAF
ncbi:MAG TPA: autotransporter domain-containing protein [bacterium]|nr:autotransporter domain-containing protein [bacterium]